MNDQRAIEVLVYGRAGFIGSFVFTTPKVTIGRDQGSMVHLDDPLVSRNHAVLTLDGGLFRIKDLGSRTGIKINGAPVRPRQPVEPTDEVSIGPFRLRVTTCEPESDGPVSDEPTRMLARSGELDAIESRPSSRLPRAPDAGQPAKQRERPPSVVPAYGGGGLEDTAATLVASLREARGAQKESRSPKPAARDDRDRREARDGQERERERDGRDTRSARERERDGREARDAREVRDEPPARAMPVSAFPIQDPTLSVSKPAFSAPATRPLVPVTQASPVKPAKPAKEFIHKDTTEMVPLAFASDEEGRARDDDDDEDDDSDFVPAFDLVAALLRPDDEKASRGRQLSLEIIHYRNDRVLSARYPHAKGPIQPMGLSEPVGAVEGEGAFVFYPEAVRSFSMEERGRVLTSAEALSMREGGGVRVAPGMQVSMDLAGDDKIFVRWVPKTEALPPPLVLQRPSADRVTTGVLSLAVHIGIMAFVGLVVLGEKKSEADVNLGRFAKVDMKELELEPPPPPPPEAPKVDMPPIVDNTPRPLEHVKQLPNQPVVTSKSTSPDPSPAQPTAASQKVVNSLNTATSALSALAITNLDALPAGAGDFKVSGAVGKAPGDTLRVAAPGSGATDINTKSATEVGKGIANVQAHTAGVVRARVTVAASAVRGEGHLDRSEIQKVVNAHLFQVQGCYERQLAHDPSIAGKISYEWVVDPSGSVSSVRIGRSSIHSVEVTTCIQSAISGWKFPQPQGGSVTVTYPFAFSSLGG